MFIALEEAVKNSDMQWALELSDRLLILEYKLDEVNNLRKQALTYLGKRSSNPNKRNYFLTSAIELNSDFKGFPKAERNEDLMKQISLDTIFKILSVSYDPTKHDNSVYKVCFNFLSGTNKTITLRNHIAAISENDLEGCNLSVEADDFDFKKVLGGIQSPVGSIADGSINIEGSNSAFLNFLLKFR